MANTLLDNTVDYNAIEELTKSFHKAGVENVRYYIAEKETDSVSLYEGGVDDSVLSRQSLCLAEGNVGGFTGAAYIENLDRAFFEDIIQALKTTARYNGQNYAEYDFSNARSSEMDVHWMDVHFSGSGGVVTDMLAAEEAAYKIDGRIRKIRNLRCVKNKESVTLMDDKGARVTNSSGYVFQNVEVLAEEKGVCKNAARYMSARFYDKRNFHALAASAAGDVLTRLHSEVPESGSCPVLLKNTVFAEILSTALPLFFGDSMLKGMSPLKEKAGQKLFSEKFSLYEDPLSVKGRVYRTFDDEGTPTSAKKIVENGVFNAALHNRTTARELNTRSTGNAFRKSVRESPSVGVTNVFVEEGDTSFDEMLRIMGRGIIVTSVQGLHAGINTLTGDISLLSAGYIVEGGKVVSGAEQMTVAGNLFPMLNDIAALGKDSEATSFSSTVNLSFVTAPAVLFGKLSVAGK